MRKSLVALLMASALGPAAAYAQDLGHEREQRAAADRVERSGQRDDDSDVRLRRSQDAKQRSERTSRPQRAERPDHADGVERQADRAPRLNPSNDLDRAMRSERMHETDRPARAERPARTERAVRDPQPMEQVQEPAIAQPVQQSRGRPDSLVDGFRQVARDKTVGRDGDRDDHHDRDWSHDWRKDKRYDWWHHRSRYSSLYRLGLYSDPYGWGYRRWAAGYRLWPTYYGSRFWLEDPWMYRLPPAYGPYRWVRYYDDALLVNIYTGHVVDTVYNFFW
jgi:hypothetical protein